MSSPFTSEPAQSTSGKTKWIVIAAALYIALPFDIVPVLGMIGDLTAFFVALNAVRAGVQRRGES